MSEKRVFLITGTSRGIGQHLAHHYAAQSSSKGIVVLGCSRTEVKPMDGYQHFCADVSKEDDVVKMFQKIRTDHGRLDVLINNAGVNPSLSLALMTPLSAAKQAMDVNFFGTFLCSREAAKIMMRKKFGRIINFGSMAVKHEVSGESMYSASKAAIGTFSRILAKELNSSGITCNVVSPAAIATDLMKQVNQEELRLVLKRNAITEPGEFQDVISLVDWLIQPESQAITGQNIYLGGA